MPTASETAAAEADTWLDVGTAAAELSRLDVPAAEARVVLFFDPRDDLAERGRAWGYEFTACDLADIARFAAGLATAEAEGWSTGVGDLATRAYAARRFLLSDRVLHWAVPWFDAIGRCHPGVRDEAHDRRDALLGLGEQHRPAPDLAQGEGLYPPGHDALGPFAIAAPEERVVRSLWSGGVILDATVRSLTTGRTSALTAGDLDDPDLRRDLGFLYQAQEARWRRLASMAPGSGALWGALADRAQRSAVHFLGLGS